MKAELFKEFLRGLVRDASYSYIDLKVGRYEKKWDNLFIKKISFNGETKCPCCGGIKKPIKLLIGFHNDVRLTMFQVNMLYKVLVERKKPFDYANYDQCVAGKRFIENIALLLTDDNQVLYFHKRPDEYEVYAK